MRLVLRGNPVPGTETLKGFLLRLTELHGYRDMRWLLSAVGLPSNVGAGRARDLAPLAVLTGADPTMLASVAYRPLHRPRGFLAFGRHSLPASMLDLVHPKVCLACASKHHLTRWVWDLRVIVACPEHGSLLLDVCPHCGRRLDWQRPGLDRCRCGKSLAEAVPQTVSSDALSVVKWLTSLEAGDNQGRKLAAAPVKNLGTAARLIWFFGTHPDPNSTEDRVWRSHYIAKPGVAGTLPIVQRAAPIVLDWPNGLYGWLDRHRASGLGGVSLHREFGSSLRRLRAALRDPDAAAVFDAVRSYLADQWDGAAHLKSWSFYYSPEPGTQHVVAGTAAARQLGTTTSKVAAMLETGELPGRSCSVGARRLHQVDVRGLKVLKRRLASTVATADVASRLGVSTFQVHRLRRRGLIRSVRHAGAYRFDPTAVEEHATRLFRLSHALDGNSSQGDLLRLADVPSIRRARLDDVIEAILTGTVAVWKSGDQSWGDDVPVFDLLWVQPSDILGHVIKNGDDIRLSVRRAATALRVAVRMVPILVAAQCLQTAPMATATHAPVGRGKRGGLGKCTILASSVSAFASRYVMARTLAKAHATSARAIIQRLSAVGVRPVVATDSRCGISSVWRMEDVARLAHHDLYQRQSAR